MGDLRTPRLKYVETWEVSGDLERPKVSKTPSRSNSVHVHTCMYMVHVFYLLSLSL